MELLWLLLNLLIEWRRIMSNKKNIFLIILIVILAIWVLRGSKVLFNIWKIKNYYNTLIKQKQDLQEKNKYLEKRLELAENYDFLKEKEIRFKFGYKRKNERIIKLKKSLTKGKKILE
ncbi:MAG: hypothetical protein FXF47_04725 [Candidatus Mcinerneyibacterium aminivorans]|uniref:Septum formation initiator family protein n=1 Tax=Candidatus Mcinerneyibacterium aminivorans TaxID=2703815 RepID=A0A5D0MC68_9BACT|nr:MAG: hypothetical protein FXF47_04725 [Candidatus Mcinerneyibacterium aminivorans]